MWTLLFDLISAPAQSGLWKSPVAQEQPPVSSAWLCSRAGLDSTRGAEEELNMCARNWDFSHFAWTASFF